MNGYLEPLFMRYVRDAFNPVGIMLDFWQEHVAPGSAHQVKIYVINDRDRPWHGTVRLRLLAAGTIFGKTECNVAPLGQAIVQLSFKAPARAGKYTLESQREDGETISNLRDFEVRK